MAKVRLDELLGVDAAVVVFAACNRFRQQNTSRVNGLEASSEVHASGYFFDENGSEPLGAQLLVDTEEVDLDHKLFADRGQRNQIACSKPSDRFQTH